MITAEPRRFAAGALTVGLAIMLILLLDGLWSGVMIQTTRYEDSVGADLYVVAPEVRALFAEGSTLPGATTETVAVTPGVRWAAPVRGRYAIVGLHERKVATMVIGAVPGQPGGHWALAAGRAVTSTDEVVVDEVLGAQHGLALGDTLDIGGMSFRVVGLSRDSSSFMTSYLFITHDALEALDRQAGMTTAVLVAADDPEAVRARLEAKGLAVLDRAEVREANVALIAKALASPMRLMLAVAFAMGTLMIALTAYTLVAERRREFGIVKAMGGTARHLTLVAIAQTAAVAVAGLAAGLVLFVVGRSVIVTARPQFAVVLTGGSLARAAGAAAAMAAVAAVVPARRLARLDPAVAYRGGS
jgi:putative ABC transport system permease protein